MQVDLPPFSDFQPSLIWLLMFAGVAGWGWSLGLLATDPTRTRLAPAWLWAALLVVAPVVAVPVFLLLGSPPIPAWVWRTISVAVGVAIVVTVGVAAAQQVDILNCRTAGSDPHTTVCEREPRSAILPAGIGVGAGIVAGAATTIRGRPRRVPQSSAT